MPGPSKENKLPNKKSPESKKPVKGNGPDDTIAGEVKSISEKWSDAIAEIRMKAGEELANSLEEGLEGLRSVEKTQETLESGINQLKIMRGKFSINNDGEFDLVIRTIDDQIKEFEDALSTPEKPKTKKETLPQKKKRIRNEYASLSNDELEKTLGDMKFAPDSKDRDLRMQVLRELTGQENTSAPATTPESTTNPELVQSLNETRANYLALYQSSEYLDEIREINNSSMVELLEKYPELKGRGHQGTQIKMTAIEIAGEKVKQHPEYAAYKEALGKYFKSEVAGKSPKETSIRLSEILQAENHARHEAVMGKENAISRKFNEISKNLLEGKTKSAKIGKALISGAAVGLSVMGIGSFSGQIQEAQMLGTSIRRGLGIAGNVAVVHQWENIQKLWKNLSPRKKALLVAGGVGGAALFNMISVASLMTMSAGLLVKLGGKYLIESKYGYDKKGLEGGLQKIEDYLGQVSSNTDNDFDVESLLSAQQEKSKLEKSRLRMKQTEEALNVAGSTLTGISSIAVNNAELRSAHGEVEHPQGGVKGWWNKLTSVFKNQENSTPSQEVTTGGVGQEAKNLGSSDLGDEKLVYGKNVIHNEDGTNTTEYPTEGNESVVGESKEIFGMDEKYVVEKGLGVTHAMKAQMTPEMAEALKAQIGYEGPTNANFYKALGEHYGYIDENGDEVRVKLEGGKADDYSKAAYQFIKTVDGYKLQESHLVGDKWVEVETKDVDGNVFEAKTADNIENPKYNAKETHDYEYLEQRKVAKAAVETTPGQSKTVPEQVDTSPTKPTPTDQVDTEPTSSEPEPLLEPEPTKTGRLDVADNTEPQERPLRGFRRQVIVMAEDPIHYQSGGYMTKGSYPLGGSPGPSHVEHVVVGPRSDHYEFTPAQRQEIMDERNILPARRRNVLNGIQWQIERQTGRLTDPFLVLDTALTAEDKMPSDLNSIFRQGEYTKSADWARVKTSSVTKIMQEDTQLGAYLRRLQQLSGIKPKNSWLNKDSVEGYLEKTHADLAMRAREGSFDYRRLTVPRPEASQGDTTQNIMNKDADGYDTRAGTEAAKIDFDKVEMTDLWDKYKEDPTQLNEESRKFVERIIELRKSMGSDFISMRTNGESAEHYLHRLEKAVGEKASQVAESASKKTAKKLTEKEIEKSLSRAARSGQGYEDRGPAKTSPAKSAEYEDRGTPEKKPIDDLYEDRGDTNQKTNLKKDTQYEDRGTNTKKKPVDEIYENRSN